MVNTDFFKTKYGVSLYPSQLQLSWSLPPLPDAQTKMEPLPFLLFKPSRIFYSKQCM